MFYRIENQPSRKRSTSLSYRQKPLLTFLHGFLGDKADWLDVIAHLKEFDCQLLDYPFKVPNKGILIGYSMGGRVALRYPHPKILLSAHPGLMTNEEMQARLKQEQFWMERLTNLPFSVFLKLWYEQPLFESLCQHSNFEEIFQRRLVSGKSAAIAQLKNECLTISNTIPAQTFFAYGKNDLKYAALYTRLGLDATSIERSGHAIHLENPSACATFIMERAKKILGYQISY